MEPNVVELVPAKPLPPPSGDPFLDALELLIFRTVAGHKENPTANTLPIAVGMVCARALYAGAPAPTDVGEYLLIVQRHVDRLSTRQRAKLRHPSRNREEAQLLLLGEHL